MWTDFQNSFTHRFPRKLSKQQLQALSPYLNCVATLPCKIQISKIMAELLLMPYKFIAFTRNSTKLNKILMTNAIKKLQ